jgi:hypothetical protein
VIRVKSFLGVACQSVVGRLWSVSCSIFHEIGGKKMCSVSVSMYPNYHSKALLFVVIETLGVEGTARRKACLYLSCTR